MKRVLWPFQLLVCLVGLAYAAIWFQKNVSGLNLVFTYQMKQAVVLAAGLMLGAYLFRVPLLCAVARLSGMKIGFGDMFVYYYGTSISAYIPGRIITSVTIAAKMGADNRPAGATVKWIVVLQATSLLACGIIAAGLLDKYIAVGLVLLVILGAVVLKRVFKIWMVSAAGMTALWVLLSLPFGVLVSIPGSGFSPGAFLRAVAVVPLAYGGSFFAAFTPDGIGVHEAIVAFTLQRDMSPSIIIPAMIGYRCLKIIFDVGFFGAALLLELLRKKKRKSYGTT
jgi:hypothetical protein